MIDHSHPAVERMAHCMTRLALPDDDWERFYEDAAFMLREALPHLTADDLRQLPQVQALIREAVVNDRSPSPAWRITPCGHTYDENLPGDFERALNLDAQYRNTMLNMRESDEGKALMAEAWEDGAQAAWGKSGEGWNGEYTGRSGPPSAFRAHNPTLPNPYKETPNE